MKKLLFNLMLLIFPVPVYCLFSSCSSDDDSYETSKDVGYFLNFRQDGDRDPYFNWTTEWDVTYFTLEFEQGIPKGSEWHLECDAPWLKLRNSHGKVSKATEQVNFTIDDNNNYPDREASVYLDVDNGLPASSMYATVTIHQYGYNTYFDWGQEISFDTNRSQADGDQLTLTIRNFFNVLEINWGDGYKQVLNEKDNYNYLSHQYSSNTKTYRVKIKFGGKIASNNMTSTCCFSFLTGAKQGITTFYDRKGYCLVEYMDDYSSRKIVTYQDGKYNFERM